MLEFQKVNPNISMGSLQLITFEKNQNINLPKDYKHFLLQTNGGIPTDYHTLEYKHNRIGSTVAGIQEIYEIFTDKNKMVTYDIADSKERMDEILPHEWDISLDIVSAEKGQVGFQIQPRRWVVGHTFACFGNYRRLSKDYEYDIQNSEGFIYLASIRTLLNRL